MSLEFRTRDGTVKALDNVSVALAPGKILGIVGESGSGKSVLAHALLGIVDRQACITSGRAQLDGRDLLQMSRREFRQLRGSGITMIFQNARAALNPIRCIGDQLVDVLTSHGSSRADAARRAVELLRMVRISDPERRLNAYPAELSGGMCQRVMIALAFACSPRVLLADEPTTGLDVTTQAAIMDLMVDLARSRGMATVFITHDLTLAAQYCDEILVMHAGQVVERGPAFDLHEAARHPYTKALFASSPSRARSLSALEAVRGSLPDLRRAMPPCRFSGRCAQRMAKCETHRPPLRTVARDHEVACWATDE